MNDIDVMIIGAGAAGLAAGAALARAGRTFLILEARNRIGGRVQTIRDPHWPAPLELGAEFIHGRPQASWEIVRQSGLQVYDVTNEHWGAIKGKPQKHWKQWDQVEQIMGRLNRVPKTDWSFAEFLRREGRTFSPGARAMAKAFVEGLDATDATLVSARSIAASEADGAKFDADTPFRISDGYDQFLAALGKPIPTESILLNTVVRTIQWSRQGVVIQTTNGERLEASRAIITLPIGVLLAAPDDAGAVVFDPPLPAATRHAVSQMRMGPVVKVALRFQRAFWEDGDWRDLAFVHVPGADFPTWWTMLPFRFPILTAWAGGPTADAMSHRPVLEVRDAALRTLSSVLGISDRKLRRELLGWHVSDWQADPYARGAYAFATVGGADAAKQLARPIEHTLYLAGEATHPGYAGTVAAAIESGHRAVKQILKDK